MEQFAAEGYFTPQTISLLKKRYAEILKRANDGVQFLERYKDNKPSYNRKWLAWYIECLGPYTDYNRLFRFLRDNGLMQYDDADLTNAWGMVHMESKTERQETAAP